MKTSDTEQDLALRGLVLDALTCLKSAHEELLQGNHERAEIYLQKAGVIIDASRKENAAQAAEIAKR